MDRGLAVCADLNSAGIRCGGHCEWNEGLNGRTDLANYML